jgi:hypothetical protein
VTDEDEYRFYPDDFDDSGELIEESGVTNPAPFVIVGSFGVGIALFFAAPFVDPIRVLGTDLELRTVSALVFATGLAAGSGIYIRQSERRLGTIHALGALGWVLLAFGTILSNAVLLAVGGGLLVAGAAALILAVLRSA